MFSIPQSETCILGAILMNPECLQQIKFELSHDDFMDQKNKVIYQTMLSLFRPYKSRDIYAPMGI